MLGKIEHDHSGHPVLGLSPTVWAQHNPLRCLARAQREPPEGSSLFLSLGLALCSRHRCRNTHNLGQAVSQERWLMPYPDLTGHSRLTEWVESALMSCMAL